MDLTLRLFQSAMIVVAAAWAIRAAPAQAAEPYGLWLTQAKTAHVEVYRCADPKRGPVCGKVVWLKEAINPDQSPAASVEDVRDLLNEDPRQRGRKMLGLELFSGFTNSPDEKDVWSDGEIYNAEDGKTYSARITLLDADTLRLRGYVGIPLLGKTQVWTRLR